MPATTEKKKAGPKSEGPQAGLTAQALLREREQYMLPLANYYAKPPVFVRGERQFLFDAEGRKYLDGFAGVVTVSVGHCHPEIVKRAQKQMEQLWHTTTLYLYPQITSFAKKLVARAKAANPALDACFFTNSGCEATELAAILAKAYTGRHEFVALRHSFHGRSLMAMTFTGQSPWRHSTPYVFGVYHAPADYTYRRPDGTTPKQYAEWCAREVGEIVRHQTSGKLAAFIGEPILGNGGVIAPEPEYLPMVYDEVKKAGGLYITDEVQCGVGRCGDDFFGIQKYGVRPDIVTMAKGLGNGFPLGAVITTREIADSLKGRLHFNTFGGNPIASTVGEAVLDVLEAEKLPQNATAVGGHLKARLEKLLDRKYVGDVRGMGLMLGVELVKDKKTKEPAPEAATGILERMKDKGVLIGKGGQAGNILRIKPPLCITKRDADQIADVFEASLKELA